MIHEKYENYLIVYEGGKRVHLTEKEEYKYLFGKIKQWFETDNK